MEDKFLSETYIRSSSSRRRFLNKGALSYQTGDVIFFNDTHRDRIRYQALRGKILYRYFTKNKGFKNYHARVRLLDGPNIGKEISIRR